MAKLTYVVRAECARLEPQQRVKVWLRVSHRSVTRYIDTGFTVGTSVIAGVRVPNLQKGFVTTRERGYERLNSEMAKSLKDYMRRLDLIANPAVVTCEEVVSILQNTGVKRTDGTLQSWATAYMEKCDEKYRKMVELSLKYWQDFLPCYTVLDAITPNVMAEFQAKLRQRPKKNGKGLLSEASVGKTLAHIRAIIRYAIEEGGVTYDTDPFVKTKIGRAKSRRCEIYHDDFVRLKTAIIFNPTDRKARDMWMLSFWMGGMNYVDMMKLDWSGDYVIFSRSKTHKKVNGDFVLPIPDEAREIVDRYMQPDGKLDLGFNYKDVTDEQRYINRRLNAFREKFGMPQSFCFYSARKTFSQFCMKKNVDKTIKHYMMAHADEKGMDYYYENVDMDMICDALDRLRAYIASNEVRDRSITSILARRKKA